MTFSLQIPKGWRMEWEWVSQTQFLLKSIKSARSQKRWTRLTWLAKRRMGSSSLTDPENRKIRSSRISSLQLMQDRSRPARCLGRIAARRRSEEGRVGEE